jgi:uncharacterized lipoprotein
MKTQMLVAASLGALILSGCSSADEKPRKGKYKPEVELTALELPGLTPDMRTQAESQMKAQFASQFAAEQCLGATEKGEWKKAAEQVSKGLGGQCSTVREASTDSSVDVEIKCTGTQMGDVTTTIKGAAESESFSMDINLNLDKLPEPTPGQGKLGMKISAKRTGDC